MSIAYRPEKFYISPAARVRTALFPSGSELTYCCDVVFANSYFELGRFLPSFISNQRRSDTSCIYFLTCLSNYLTPPYGGVFLSAKQQKDKEVQAVRKSADMLG